MKYIYVFLVVILTTPSFAQKSFQCYNNKFWSVNSADEIYQYTLTAGSITIDSLLLSNAFSVNLAFSNNLDNITSPPTFYNTNTTQIAYFDGSGWTASPVTSTNPLYNGGGFGNYLYFTSDPGSGLDAIVRYDGTSLTSIYTVTDSLNRSLSVADIAVDESGNIWFFTGENGSTMTDTLNVVSPAGILLSQYPVSFYTQGAYGCFMLNSELYVGFGGVNPVQPNSLLPITISGGAAVKGLPIAMPSAGNNADLASCNPGIPLSVINKKSSEFSVFPNPTSKHITITATKEDTFYLYSSEGRIIKSILAPAGQVTISLNELSAGIYFIKAADGLPVRIVKVN